MSARISSFPEVTLGPCRLINADCFDVAADLGEYHAVIADPPYSARTHSGHDGAESNDGAARKGITYAAWTRAEVNRAMVLVPSSGWVCILTDHILARDWEEALQRHGRYVFAPLPLVTRGRSVRLQGDGPSSWTDWLVCARTKAESKWGTLPGSYEGHRGTIEHMGGKALNAMCGIVNDYSRSGMTVLDFCMGAGTTGIACIRTGRKFVGIERDPAHFATACDRIRRELQQQTLDL